MENRLSKLKNTTIYTCSQYKCIYIRYTWDIIQKEQKKTKQSKATMGLQCRENSTPWEAFLILELILDFR